MTYYFLWFVFYSLQMSSFTLLSKSKSPDAQSANIDIYHGFSFPGGVRGWSQVFALNLLIKR